MSLHPTTTETLESELPDPDARLKQEIAKAEAQKDYGRAYARYTELMLRMPLKGIASSERAAYAAKAAYVKFQISEGSLDPLPHLKKAECLLMQSVTIAQQVDRDRIVEYASQLLATEEHIKVNSTDVEERRMATRRMEETDAIIRAWESKEIRIIRSLQKYGSMEARGRFERLTNIMKENGVELRLPQGWAPPSPRS